MVRFSRSGFGTKSASRMQTNSLSGFDRERIRLHSRRGFRSETGSAEANHSFFHRPESRDDSDALGSSEPPLFAPHPRPGHVPRRPFAPRTNGPQPERSLL